MVNSKTERENMENLIIKKIQTSCLKRRVVNQKKNDW